MPGLLFAAAADITFRWYYHDMVVVPLPNIELSCIVDAVGFHGACCSASIRQETLRGQCWTQVPEVEDMSGTHSRTSQLWFPIFQVHGRTLAQTR